jgi:hypothetical protein
MIHSGLRRLSARIPIALNLGVAWNENPAGGLNHNKNGRRNLQDFAEPRGK